MQMYNYVTAFLVFDLSRLIGGCFGSYAAHVLFFVCSFLSYGIVCCAGWPAAVACQVRKKVRCDLAGVRGLGPFKVTSRWPQLGSSCVRHTLPNPSRPSSVSTCFFDLSIIATVQYSITLIPNQLEGRVDRELWSKSQNSSPLFVITDPSCCQL